MTPFTITFTAICIALNYIGANIALFLKLPVYLDTFGTILASLILGPIFGVGTAIASALISAFTTDISAIYFSPVAILLALLVSLPATALASLITVIVFKGITPSGSSIIVQGLHGFGLDLVTSTIIVQALTDYADRLIVIGVSLVFIPQLKKVSPRIFAKSSNA